MNVPLSYDDSYLVAMYKAMADAQPALLWASDTTGACTHFNATWLAFRAEPSQASPVCASTSPSTASD